MIREALNICQVLLSLLVAAAPVLAAGTEIPPSVMAQPDAGADKLTPAQIKYIEARMDARGTLASGKTVQQGLEGFARHYDRVTDFQILGFAAIVGSSVAAGLMAAKSPDTQKNSGT